MSLHSLFYFVFLAAVWLLARLWPHPRSKQTTLLLASWGFYWWWSPPFLLLLVLVSLFNHLWGRRLRYSPRLSILWSGVLVNLGVLISLKYTSLLSWAMDSAAGAGWLVPVGISFYTFQAISHLVDVYRGADDNPNRLEFLLYMAFWPIVLSGPICRVPEMVPQFRSMTTPAGADVTQGTRRIVLGLFMKVVLADTLAAGINNGPGINFGFDDASNWSTLDILVLTFGYSLQLFFDFAGYSHTAIGSAQLFGLRLRENFNDPYAATSLPEFWNRWHMSLSSWIRDYVFFPLAALRRSRFWRAVALTLSMIAFGVWHGLSWSFACWGAYHGLLLTAHRLWLRRSPSHSILVKSFKWAGTLLLVSIGWIFFRSPNLHRAGQMLTSLGHPWAASVMPLEFVLLVAGLGLGLALVLVVKRQIRGGQMPPLLQQAARLVSPVGLVTMIILVIIWSDTTSPFVYVRF